MWNTKEQWDESKWPWECGKGVKKGRALYSAWGCCEFPGGIIGGTALNLSRALVLDRYCQQAGGVLPTFSSKSIILLDPAKGHGRNSLTLEVIQALHRELPAVIACFGELVPTSDDSASLRHIHSLMNPSQYANHCILTPPPHTLPKYRTIDLVL